MNPRILLIFLTNLIISSCNNNSNINEKPSSVDTAIDTSDYSNKSNDRTFTIQETIDSLYTDTIEHRDNFDETKVDTFYFKEIKKLVTLISKDKNNPNTLFPCTSFDKVIGQDISNSESIINLGTKLGEPKQLNNSQTARLLKIVNNPLNFNWGECGTWTPTAKFLFYYDDKIVQTLDIGCSCQLKANYSKMKFGTLNQYRCSELMNLCHELGLKNK